MGKQKDEDSSDEAMEIEEEPNKRKPKRVKRIIKLAKKEEKQKPMTIEDILGKGAQKKVAKKTQKEREVLEKKINLFHEIKNSVGNINTKKLSKGQKRRLERKQKILFKKVVL